MKRHLILLFSILAGAAAAQTVMHNMVSRQTPVNTNLIGAVIGEGLSLSNGVLSSTGGGGLTTNDVRAIAIDATGAEWVPEDREVNVDGRLWARGIFVDGGIFAMDDIHAHGFDTFNLDHEDFYGWLYSHEWRYDPDSYDPGPDREIAVKGDLTPLARSDSLGTAAYKDASEFATAADEALIYQLIMGSNVVAEVTNSRTRSPQLRLLQLDADTKEYFPVWTETNGLARTLAAATEHTDAATNALGLAKADRAWSHSTSGLGAEAPAGVTWISTPETVVAGGYEYAKQITSHGEVWVLTSNGLGLGADTNAYFAVRSGDGETLFSIEKTDSILVGVDADGISVSGGVVTIPLGVVSQDPPVCYAANSLINATWADLTQTPLPAWVTSATCTGAPGAWVWSVETTAPSAFFQFRVLQPGATVIRNNAQTDLSAGILINGTRYYPHASGGTLTWTTTP